MNRRPIMGLVCLPLLALQLWGAETPNAVSTDSPNSNATIAATSSAPTTTNSADLQQLKDRIAKQEEEIKKLQQSLDEQRTVLEKAVSAASAPAAVTNVNVANTTATNSAPVQMVPAVNVARPRFGGAFQKTDATAPSPLSLSIGSATFTPLGFIDTTWFTRSTNTGSGIGTGFSSIPFNNVPAAHISENNMSLQNSRLGMRIDSTVLGSKVIGYWESDFLFNNNSTGFQTTSNAAGFRMRLFWADITKNGFEILAGQSWSMLTPNRKGLSPIPGDIFYTQDFDTNYQNGLVWTRAPQVRFIGHPSDNFAIGVALENPQQYTGGAVTFPTAFTTAPNTIANQFGGASGATSTNVPNLHPDIIMKAAYDGHVGNGQIMHVEVGGFVRSFKDVISTTPTGQATTYTTNVATGGGGTLNANLEVVKNFRIIANTFFGDGGGRYIGGEGPDLIVRADGSISPIHSYSTVDGFEATMKNTLLYSYYGGAYYGRDVTQVGSTLYGYGYRGSANSNNRSIQEATIGITQTFWKNANYGALSLMMQYSYLWRNPWYLAPGAARYAHTNIGYINLRYTLP